MHLYIKYMCHKSYRLRWIRKVKVKSESESCSVRLLRPMDCTVHGILQARILEWVAFPCPGDLPNPGIEPRSPALQEDALPAEPQRWIRTDAFIVLSIVC